MARLTIPLNDPTDAVRVDLSLDITHRSFEHGWIYYEIRAEIGGQPILNGMLLKTASPERAVPQGSVDACEDEFCSLLPVMRRFIETGKAEEWMPTEPDVILQMEPGSASHLVSLRLDIDMYQWRGVTAYGGALVSVRFDDCTAAEFRQFYQDLRAEFVTFAEANDIKSYNIAHGFDHPYQEWF